MLEVLWILLVEVDSALPLGGSYARGIMDIVGRGRFSIATRGIIWQVMAISNTRGESIDTKTITFHTGAPFVEAIVITLAAERHLAKPSSR